MAMGAIFILMPNKPKSKTKNKPKNKKKIIPIEERISASIGSVESLYIHTFLFLLAFIAILFGFSAETVLLVLTTLVSLEAIYLAIFIQMAVNKNTASLEEVEEELDEIQEDIDEIQEDIDDIQEDIEEEIEMNESADDKRDRKYKEDQDKFALLEDKLTVILEELKNIKNNK